MMLSKARHWFCSLTSPNTKLANKAKGNGLLLNQNSPGFLIMAVIIDPGLGLNKAKMNCQI
jgi:hypothetical protein